MMFKFFSKEKIRKFFEKQQEFTIPVLIKRSYTAYPQGYGTKVVNGTEYEEATTNGFFYEADCDRFFRVRLTDPPPRVTDIKGAERFIAEKDLVFCSSATEDF